MIGILLLGGTGTRLYPLTKVVNKHLLPVYNKPLVYYSISILMLLGIKKIILVVNKEHINDFKSLFKDGSKYGIEIQYVIQKKPLGIVNAIQVSKKKIKKNDFVLMLGDNFFYGNNLINDFKKIKFSKHLSQIICKEVSNPQNYGVLIKNKNKFKIIEKPRNPKTNLAVCGIYFYKNKVLKFLKKVKKTNRKEFEISDFNNILINNNLLRFKELPRGNTWFDCGSVKDFNEVTKFVEIIEKRQNIMIGSLGEIAFRKKWINKKKLIKIADNKKELDYFKTL